MVPSFKAAPFHERQRPFYLCLQQLSIPSLQQLTGWYVAVWNTRYSQEGRWREPGASYSPFIHCRFDLSLSVKCPATSTCLSTQLSLPALLQSVDLVLHLGQGLANSGSRAKSSQTDAHSHSHAHSFTDHCWMLLYYNGRDEHLWQRPSQDLQTLRCLLFGPLQKKICWPLYLGIPYWHQQGSFSISHCCNSELVLGASI